MSERYKGGVISATPPTTSQTAATGVWTMEQQMQAVAAGNWPPNGPFFIEDVFSTYLYTGTGSAQTITNNINLSGSGGMVWTKGRSVGENHGVSDTVRGANATVTNNNGALITNGTSSGSTAGHVTAFNSNGFTLGTSVFGNGSGTTYASWTFRKQPKFFDVVTYTGDGTNDRAINHNLGSVPGCIIVKRTDLSSSWSVYHRSLPAATYNRNLYLNTTAAYDTNAGIWGASDPTATQFRVGSVNNLVNVSGGTYVAYLFAHDAGGFGNSGSDNVITCGSVTTNGSGAGSVTLNYEPQWVLLKSSQAVENWQITDVMRGMPVGSDDALLLPNSSAAESTYDDIDPTSTGFNIKGLNASQTYIYIAIRRGPMKTPTDATKVFAVTSFTGVDATQTAGFTVDFVPNAENLSGTIQWQWVDRLRGNTKKLESNSTSAEGTVSNGLWDSNTQVRITSSGNSYKRLYPMFARAPGFFDEVCYTGAGGVQTVNHNLGVVPEMMIVKHRNGPDDWAVYHSALGNTKYLWINSTNAEATSQFYWNNTTPTSSVFTLGGQGRTNDNGGTYVAYLFATVAGVSKVGSYTGTGNTLQINCGFTNGSRFVLIKRTDSTGDWYVWNSATGIVAGNDPYVLFNSTAAEVTTTDWVDTYSLGFELSNAVGNNVNINTATYIFLAIA